MPFNTLTAIAAPIMRSNIDTDVIIRIERLVGNNIRGTLGKWAFGSLRYLPDGSENPEFILNREPYREAEILVKVGDNVKGGSSVLARWMGKSTVNDGRAQHTASAETNLTAAGKPN